MKTSTKLLIVLLACVPVSLWGYNDLLQKQLKAKKIAIEYTPDLDKAFTKTDLPAFKHVVIDGRLYYGDTIGGMFKARSVTWRPSIRLNNYTYDKPNSEKPNWVKIVAKAADIFKYHITNDTLYISFYKPNNPGQVNNTYYYEVLKINAEHLLSVTGADAVITTDGGFKTADSLKITLSGQSQYNISSAVFDKMNVLLKDYSNITLQGMGLNHLSYSLLNNSSMDVNPKFIKHFSAGQIDSTAQIAIRGSASNGKYLLK